MENSMQRVSVRKLSTKAISFILALAMILSIAPITVFATTTYATQGDGLKVFMSSPTNISTDESLSTDDYYYNVINTSFLAGSDLVFKIAAGGAPGINNNTTVFNNHINIYSSMDFTQTPVATFADFSVTNAGNSAWPDTTTSAGRAGRTFTLTLADGTLPYGATYYLVIDDIGSTGNQGSASIGKKIVFKFSISSVSTAVNSVSLNQNAIYFEGISGTYTLVPKVSPTTATNKAVTFTSSNPSVATVSSSGVVTPVAEGTTTITVKTIDGNYTDQCNVIVKDSSKNRVFVPVSGIQQVSHNLYGYEIKQPSVIKNVADGTYLVCNATSMSILPTFNFAFGSNGGKKSSVFYVNLYSDSALTQKVEEKQFSGAPEFTYTPDSTLLSDGNTYYVVIESNSQSGTEQLGEQLVFEFTVGQEYIDMGLHTHSYREATCSSPRTCTICGRTEGEIGTEHVWFEATCLAPKTCSECGITEGDPIGHTWVDADCTTPKTCSGCEATEGEALGHIWVDADCTTPKTCSACEATEGEALGHTLENNFCTACGAIDSEYVGMLKVDGVWSYVKNGAVDTSYTGVSVNSYGKRYIKNGVFDSTKTGLVKMPATSDFYAGKYVYVKAGKIMDSYTGIMKNGTYGYRYVVKGVWDSTKTGLIKMPACTEYQAGKYVYIKAGKFMDSYTGLMKNGSYGYRYVVKGVWSQTTGLIAMPSSSEYQASKWVYIEAGKFTQKWTGIATNKYGKRYVKNSVFASSFSGKVTYQGKTYTIKNGKVV